MNDMSLLMISQTAPARPYRQPDSSVACSSWWPHFFHDPEEEDEMRRPSFSRSIVAFKCAIISTIRTLIAWYRRPQWLPAELAGSKIAFAEKTFSMHHPVRLLARIDRAYDNGLAIVLLELKVRRSIRVYQSDIIELSAQRAVLRSSTGREVAPYGFVLLLHPTTRRKSVHKVTLLSAGEVATLAIRRRQLIDGLVSARRPRNSAICSTCEYAKECADAFIASRTG